MENLSLEGKRGLNNQEIMIMCNVQEILKQFVKEAPIIWHDPNINSQENLQFQEELKTISDLKTFANRQEAISYIKSIKVPFCQVIISGADGESFVKEISNIHNNLVIHIFSRDMQSHKTWASQYPEVVSVDDELKNLFANVHEKRIFWQKESSSLKDFPVFASIFDDIDKSKNHYLHFYLKGFVNFKNREQSKDDFLALAKALYGNNKDIDGFQQNYNDYSMKIFSIGTLETASSTS